MKIETIAWAGTDTPEHLTHLIEQAGRAPDFVSLHMNADIAQDAIKALFPLINHPLHGATSCKGSASEGALDLSAATAFCIWDEDGDFGTGLAAFGEISAEEAGEHAARAALTDADRDGEKPDMILVSATPGAEEAVLRGIMAVVGEDVPIFGGTAADNTVSGGWCVSDGEHVHGQGVVVSVLFPSTQVHFAYHNGYAPGDGTGTVTKADGRKLIEIDGTPAAEIYNTWTGQAILPQPLGSEHNILAEATMAPLGMQLSEQNGLANYLLLHPAQLHADGSLGLFAEVSEGAVLTPMVGDRATLAERAGRVAAQAVNMGELNAQDIAGAYMIYCGGCLMAVEDRVPAILEGVQKALPNAPFQAAFTFGEQGLVHNAGNRHGNLMISCVVFTNRPN